MNDVFLVIIVISMVGLATGLFRPTLVRLPSREHVSFVFGVVIIMSFMLFVAFQGEPAPPQSATHSKAQARQTVAPATDEDKLRALVSTVFDGTTNSSNEPRLRSVEIVPQEQGGYGVFVDFNGNDNLTAKLTKLGLERDMSDLYIALYTSGLDVRTASAAGYLQLTDKYGNTSDGIVYKSDLTKDVADKVNWSADRATLELQILPGAWATSLLSPARR